MNDRSVSRRRVPRRLTVQLAAALFGTLLVAGACGSTLDERALNAQFDSGPVTPGTQTPQAAAPAPGGSDVAATPSTAAVPGAVANAGSSAPATRTATGANPGLSSDARVPGSSVATAGSPTASGAKGSAGARPGTATAATPAPVPGAPAGPGAVSGPKSEIVFGSYGIESGVIGTATLPIHQAARAWVADINARGGLGGHPIRLIMGDDEGDPNKALSLVRRMVEQDGAVAIFAEHACTTAQAVLPYLEQRKIPSIAPSFCAGPNPTWNAIGLWAFGPAQNEGAILGILRCSR